MIHSEDRLSDEDLGRYLAGDADIDLQRRIEQSEEHSSLVNGFAEISSFLQETLYRRKCPSTEALGNYHLQLLTEDSANSIHSHIQYCPHCTRELVILQQQLGAPLISSSPSFVGQIKIIIAKAMQSLNDANPNTHSFQPAFAVRGGEERDQIFSDFDGLQLTIDIQDDTEQIGYKAITGLILGIPNKVLTIYLWSNDKLIDSVQSSPTGNFLLDKIDPGDYELIISGQDMIVHLQTLTVHD